MCIFRVIHWFSGPFIADTAICQPFRLYILQFCTEGRANRRLTIDLKLTVQLHSRSCKYCRWKKGKHHKYRHNKCRDLFFSHKSSSFLYVILSVCTYKIRRFYRNFSVIHSGTVLVFFFCMFIIPYTISDV